MGFNLYKIVKYQLYLLQLENYELGRLWELIVKKGIFPAKDQRKDLVWTKKAALILVVSELIIFVAAGSLSLKLFRTAIENTAAAAVIFIVLAAVFNLLFFVFAAVSTLIVSPVDFFAKRDIVGKAKSKLAGLSNIKVIGIAGSYGKTTMKEVLRSVLSTRYKVQATPESVNTPVGIGRWILNSVNVDTEILIVEMGEHYKGDIRDLCKMVYPNIAVVTGINESHLERMGSLENIAATILEIQENLTAEDLLVVNADDEYLHKLSTELKNRKISYYGSKRQELTGFYLENIKFDSEKLLWDFDIPSAHLKIQLPLLGEYALGLAVAAAQVAGDFKKMQAEDIARGLAQVKPVEHRLQPILSGGNILVIDDSYNGNPEGVKQAIQTLARFSAKGSPRIRESEAGGSASGGTNRRKLYITPGLVEMGSSAKEVHLEIGKQLAEVADVVILIKNSATPWVAEGMKSASQLVSKSAPQIIWFNTALEAHAELKNILKPNDVIVFQNDWGDQYL